MNNLPTVNTVKAGSAVLIKFSLSGDKGLNIFVVGYPKSQQIPCDGSAPSDDVEETSTASTSSLQYDAATDTYTYVWKTDKSWKDCRQLVVKLSDGTEHTAMFQFK